ncbi:hypothetical protein QOL99_15225 [Deinococcus sp. MIMF12]|uniref:Uncharacterized protein n=1 Tax=Deinococcus rhizophilus TaxID=3049544 RepID=A0ABT7JKJ7_9DEIO|nr:hypothetical protein [Deinococcus rhizophilus]MDL2345491.1 hypothetical protein [Deinococcus rhizophilus]
MRPDEWQQAMENEAASVEDGGWARETRRFMRVRRGYSLLGQVLPPLMSAALLAACWHGLVVLVARALWQMDRNPLGVWGMVHPMRFDLAFLGLLIGVGLMLGALRVRPLPGGALLALIPLWAWLIGAAVRYDGVWRGPDGQVMDAAARDFVTYTLTGGSLTFAAGCAVFGMLSIWVGSRLSRPRA